MAKDDQNKDQKSSRDRRPAEPPQVTKLKALRTRVQNDAVFGKDEALELLNVLIGDYDSPKVDETPNPPQTDNTGGDPDPGNTGGQDNQS